MVRKTAIVVLMVLALALPALAGQSKYFSGKSYVLPEDKTVDGDLFVFSDSIRIEGEVTGEAFFIGSNISVTGTIMGDAFILGDSVKLSGREGSDARILGNTVDLAGEFDGEILVVGRKVSIAAAEVAGVVSAAGETISAGGTFADIVSLHGRSVSILPEALFEKDVNVSAEEFAKADSASISGKLNRIIGGREDRDHRGVGGVWIMLVFWLVTLCGIIVVGLIVNRLFPDLVAGSVAMIADRTMHSLGWGLVVILLSPIVLVLLMITLVGIPLALLLLVTLFVGLYLGKLFVSIFVGGLLISRFLKEEAPFWTRLIVGAVVVYLVLAVPFAGFFFAVIVYCLGVGALVNLFIASRKKAVTVAVPAREAPVPVKKGKK